MPELAIIAGSSVNTLDNFEILNEPIITSRYGKPASGLCIGKYYGHEVVFINRHGTTNKLAPHTINYRANIDALSQLGVKKIIALNAVGGISDFAKPLHLSVPSQIIDYTSGRSHTFFEGGDQYIEYADFAEPIDSELKNLLIKSCKDLKLDETEAGFSQDTCYGCTQGPRLETKAEILRMQRDGCDLVGMTMMPEAALAMEKQIAYASLCLVVNKASGMGAPLSLEDVYQTIEVGDAIIEKCVQAFMNQS